MYFSKSSFLCLGEEGEDMIEELRRFVETAVFPLVGQKLLYRITDMGVAISPLCNMIDYQQMADNPVALVWRTLRWGSDGHHRVINAACKLRPAAREGQDTRLLYNRSMRDEYQFQDIVRPSAESAATDRFSWGDYPGPGAVFARSMGGRTWLVSVDTDGLGIYQDDFVAGMIADFLNLYYPG